VALYGEMAIKEKGKKEIKRRETSEM